MAFTLLLALAFLSLANTSQSANNNLHVNSANKSLEPIQSNRNGRLTFMGVSSGLTFRNRPTILEDGFSGFGKEPCRYLKALFLVEYFGQPKGNKGEIKVIGPKGKIKFYCSSTRVRDYDFYAKRLNHVAMEFLPALDKCTTEAYLVEEVWQVKDQELPKTFSVSAVFFGKKFRFHGINLP